MLLLGAYEKNGFIAKIAPRCVYGISTSHIHMAALYIYSDSAPPLHVNDRNWGMKSDSKMVLVTCKNGQHLCVALWVYFPPRFYNNCRYCDNCLKIIIVIIIIVNTIIIIVIIIFIIIHMALPVLLMAPTLTMLLSTSLVMFYHSLHSLLAMTSTLGPFLFVGYNLRAVLFRFAPLTFCHCNFIATTSGGWPIL